MKRLLPCAACLLAACQDAPSAPAPPEDPLAGLTRVDATTCRPLRDGERIAPPRLKLTHVLSDLGRPVDLLPAPDGSGRVFIVDQAGRILSARLPLPDGESPAPWLRIEDRVYQAGESGLLSMAFHPRFAQNGRFYVFYTHEKGAEAEAVVSRFLVPAPPLGAPDPKSEQVLLRIDKPYFNHNGGQLAFGPDGALYVSTGDGGGAGDPLEAGQDLSSLLGKILRLDVDGDAGYRVPPDNPFVGQAGARPEIWAYGLRNPWRFSFDPVEGTLWVGDVGQDREEEIDIIKKGGNYGWSVAEGRLCYRPMEGCSMTGLTPPVHTYDRGDGQSVTGGRVYRGKAMPGLYGTYVFADFVTPVLWGLAPGPEGELVRTTLADEIGINISALGRDADEELYALDWATGRAFLLQLADPGQPGSPGWAATLRETGCFADLPTRLPARGALRYEVNAPLWSDGADKERALFLPPGGRIGLRDDGPWELPQGTVLMKTFVLAGQPLETRLLVRDGAGWRGATYRWDPDGGDGRLLSGAVQAEVKGRGGPPQTWHFPGRAECAACHTRAAGQVLGLSTPQMNRDHDLLGIGRSVSQIDALRRLSYLDKDPGPASALPRFPATGAGAARAYLHANCAHCHLPGGVAGMDLDLRHATPLGRTGACGARPQKGDAGVPGALLLAPGAPERSTLALRMASRLPGLRMPPLASEVPDPSGVELVRAWIQALPGCD